MTLLQRVWSFNTLASYLGWTAGTAHSSKSVGQHSHFVVQLEAMEMLSSLKHPIIQDSLIHLDSLNSCFSRFSMHLSCPRRGQSFLHIAAGRRWVDHGDG